MSSVVDDLHRAAALGRTEENRTREKQCCIPYRTLLLSVLLLLFSAQFVSVVCVCVVAASYRFEITFYKIKSQNVNDKDDDVSAGGQF